MTGLPALIAALSERGYDEEALDKLSHANWLRVLEETWHPWGRYLRLAGDDPRATLVDALERFPAPGLAVDLGAGTGRDSAELLRRGWSVIAFDREQDARRSSGCSSRSRSSASTSSRARDRPSRASRSTGTSTTSSRASGRYLPRVREAPLGSSGLRVPVVGLGCNAFGWRIDEQATRAVIDAALDAGITFFDTAESYGEGESEAFLGRALAGRRDRVVIGTKFGWGKGRGDNEIARGAPAYVRTALERSLRRLGTDYVDLYQYHRPDGVTPIAETLGVLDELVSEGKVRAIGSSNMSAAELREADSVAATQGLARFVSAQNEYSLLERDAERELIPACEELGLGFIPYFPLARGLLTGKYRRGEDAPQGSRLAGEPRAPERPVGPDRVARGVRRASRDRPARRRDRGSRGPAGGRLGDRRGDAARAGPRLNAAAGAWEPAPAALAELRAL